VVEFWAAGSIDYLHFMAIEGGDWPHSDACSVHTKLIGCHATGAPSHAAAPSRRASNEPLTDIES
jgi:hypothetical protein